MDIIKYDIYRGPNIGIYANVNDHFVFVPSGFAKSKAINLEKFLDAKYLLCSIANTRLLGTMMVVNNNGILLPRNVQDHEMSFLKKNTNLNVEILDTKNNALGNLISANDKGAIVSPIIEKSVIKKIEDVLGVEVVQKRIAGYIQTGAMIVANNSGGVIHPETDEEDVKMFANVLGVKLEMATINGGIPYLASGILANNHGIVVGTLTNGPEIMMLSRAFLN